MSQRPPPRQRPERAGRAGLAATGVSIALTFLAAGAGTSVMEPPYPGRPGQPPWAASAHLSAYAAVALAGAALAAGTAGLALTLRAMRRGWSFPARYVLLAGLAAAVLLTLVPPFGSSDPLSYAAYGRMLVTGHNPYTTGPDMLARLGDPVARAVQDWYTSPSDYGTVATGGQALASLIGGTSARLTVFILSVLNLAAFGGTGLLLHRMGRGDRRRQLRAALLWTANPLLLQELVAGAHVDSQAVFFGVAAVAVFSPVVDTAGRAGAGLARAPARAMLGRAAAAGALIGLGFAVKVTVALLGAGLVAVAVQAFPPRRAGGDPAPGWRPLLAVAGGLAAGFAAVAGTALAIGGRAGFQRTVQASSLVSIGSPWRVIRTLLHLGISAAAADDAVKAAAAVLAVGLAVLLLRGLPGAPARASRRPADAGDAAAGGHGDVTAAARAVPAGQTAGRVALAFALAWLLAWPYMLPWYDALAWALLPLVAASGLDWLLLARTAALAFGYLPARVAGVALPGGLGWLQSVVRTGVTPAVLAVVVVWAALSMRRGRAAPPGPGRPAGPPPARQAATDRGPAR